MKVGILFVAIFALALLTLPMIAMYSGERTEAVVHTPILPQHDLEAQAEETDSTSVREEETPEIPVISEDEPADAAGVLSFMILDESTGNVNEVGVRDYVRGAVAAEMPVSFHSEALKAQAVAAHTYALHNHIAQKRSPDPALRGADFAADPSNMKVYITEETAREFYGELYADIYWQKICDAADAVLPYVLEYGGEPIVAAYHAMSAGRTESAANVWTGSAEYLIPADSEGDLLAPDYETSTVIPVESVRNALQTAYSGVELGGDPSGWFSGIRRSDSGYVTNVEVGGLDLHGKEIRMLFGLRSHNMNISYANGGFAFTVRGYGHGVGLSQYGADFLARQGYSFDQILDHYYTGVGLRQVIFGDSI